MPRYRYSCNSCEAEFFAIHSWEEVQNNCTECDSSDIIKLLTRPLETSNKHIEKTGQVTKEYIDANKEVLEDLKNSSKSENYEPS